MCPVFLCVRVCVCVCRLCIRSFDAGRIFRKCLCVCLYMCVHACECVCVCVSSINHRIKNVTAEKPRQTFGNDRIAQREPRTNLEPVRQHRQSGISVDSDYMHTCLCILHVCILSGIESRWFFHLFSVQRVVCLNFRGCAPNRSSPIFTMPSLCRCFFFICRMRMCFSLLFAFINILSVFRIEESTRRAPFHCVRRRSTIYSSERARTAHI